MSGLKRFSPLRREDPQPVLLQMDSCLTVQYHKRYIFEFQQGIQDKVFHYQLTPGAANKKDMPLFEVRVLPWIQEHLGYTVYQRKRRKKTVRRENSGYLVWWTALKCYFCSYHMTRASPTHLIQCISAAVKQISRDWDGFYITAGSTQRDHMFPP